MLQNADCRFRGFHGRPESIQALATALHRAREFGEGRTILILGDPGIGKSRLLREFAREIPAETCVLRGSAIEYARPAYGIIIEALESDVKAAGEAVRTLEGEGGEHADPGSARRRGFLAIERHL